MAHRPRRSPIRGALVASLLVAVGLLSAGSAQAATLPTLTLTITGSSLTVTGTPQSGGVNVVTSVTGVKEASAVLFLLKPGVGVPELEAGLKGGGGKDPNRVSKYGAITFDTEVSPGHGSEAQTILVPGQYVALVPEKHKKPKLQTFTVTAAPSPVPLPTPEATVRAIDFGFAGPTTLHDGELVRFENEGFLVHMDIAFPAKSKSSAKRIVKALLSGNEKGLEKLVVGEPFAFAGPVSHEAFQQETITAKPGWYVQACFMETQTGVDHTRLGMERIIKITK